MPTYGYRCPACGQDYEAFQKISDATKAPCPECGTPGERQISGGAGVVFKGSGFYETDYKRAGAKSKGDSASTGDPPAGKDGGSGDKPAKKKDSSSKGDSS